MQRIITVLVLIGLLCSCEDILEVPDISTEQVTLLAPLDQSSLVSNRINFNWAAVEDATGYRVLIARPNFETAAQIVLDSLLVEDTLGFVETKILQFPMVNGIYEWRVKAINSDFETPFSTAAFLVSGDEDAMHIKSIE